MKILPDKFDQLLHAMLTKAPKPVGKTSKARPSSAPVPSANYSGSGCAGLILGITRGNAAS
jgi:hypothetical protein